MFDGFFIFSIVGVDDFVCTLRFLLYAICNTLPSTIWSEMMAVSRVGVESFAHTPQAQISRHTRMNEIRRRRVRSQFTVYISLNYTNNMIYANNIPSILMLAATFLRLWNTNTREMKYGIHEWAWREESSVFALHTYFFRLMMKIISEMLSRERWWCEGERWWCEGERKWNINTTNSENASENRGNFQMMFRNSYTEHWKSCCFSFKNIIINNDMTRSCFLLKVKSQS